MDLKRGRVRVRGSVSDVNGHLHYGPPKNGKVREFALPPFLVTVLREHLGDRRADRNAYVFGGQQPLYHSNFYARHFKPAVRRALLPELHAPRFHDLRQTAAALLIANGEHPKAVQERLGHSSITITMDRYGHLFPSQEEALVARLEETYRGAAGAEPPLDAVMRVLR